MPEFKTLRSKFVVSALVIVLVVTLAICALIYYVVGGMLNQSVFDHIESSTLNSAQQINAWFSKERTLVEYLSDVMRSLSDDAHRRAIIGGLYSVTVPYIGLTEGGVICGCGWDAPEGWPVGRPWFNAAMASRGEIAFTSPYVCADTGGLIITVSKYIGELEGRGAVFAVDSSITEVIDIVWDANTIPGSYAVLVDQSGMIVAHTNNAAFQPTIVDGETAYTNMRDIGMYQQFLDSGDSLVQVQDDTDIAWYLTAHRIQETDWTLIMAIPTAFLQTGVMDLMFRTILAAALVAVLLMFIIWFAIGRAITKPIESLVIGAKEISEGNLAVNFDISRKDEIGELAQSFGNMQREIITMIDEIQMRNQEIAKGNFSSSKNHVSVKGDFQKILNGVDSIAEDFMKYLDYLDCGVDIYDADFRLTFINATNRNSGFDPDKMLNKTLDEIMSDAESEFMQSKLKQAASTGEIVRYPKKVSLPNGDLVYAENAMIPVKDNNGKIISYVNLAYNTTEMVNAQKRSEKINSYQGNEARNITKKLQNGLEKGILQFVYTPEAADNDTAKAAAAYKKIGDTMEHAVTFIKGYVDEISQLLQEFSNENFDVTIKQNYIGDFSSIKTSIERLINSIGVLVSEIQISTEQVESGAGHIAHSTQELMGKFEEQAAAMSEIKGAVSVLAEKTLRNAEESKTVNNLSEQAQEAAYDGTRHMKDLSVAMEEIKNSSAEIAEVANIIEGIAFQTNLLALNASVEAARAGEHGKGFSVVADEVRNLAGRSSTAAKDAADMIAKSLNRVEEGVAKSEHTAQALRSIAEITTNVTSTMLNITNVSNEQADEIDRIQNSMDEIYRGTSDNNMAVQKNASVSQELSSQASMLKDLVGRFRISKK